MFIPFQASLFLPGRSGNNIGVSLTAVPVILWPLLWNVLPLYSLANGLRCYITVTTKYHDWPDWLERAKGLSKRLNHGILVHFLLQFDQKVQFTVTWWLRMVGGHSAWPWRSGFKDIGGLWVWLGGPTEGEPQLKRTMHGDCSLWPEGSFWDGMVRKFFEMTSVVS